MKKKKPTRKLRQPITLIGVVVLCCIGVAVLAFSGIIHLHTTKRTITAQQQRESQTDAANKKAFTEQSASKSVDSSTSSQQDITAATTNPNNITLTATQSSSSAVTVSTKLVGYSDGACSLTVKNGSKSTSLSARIIYAPDFSTCAGFNVPINDLGSGNWSITLSVTSKGNTQTKTTSLEVK